MPRTPAGTSAERLTDEQMLELTSFLTDAMIDAVTEEQVTACLAAIRIAPPVFKLSEDNERRLTRIGIAAALNLPSAGAEREALKRIYALRGFAPSPWRHWHASPFEVARLGLIAVGADEDEQAAVSPEQAEPAECRHCGGCYENCPRCGGSGIEAAQEQLVDAPTDDAMLFVERERDGYRWRTQALLTLLAPLLPKRIESELRARITARPPASLGESNGIGASLQEARTVLAPTADAPGKRELERMGCSEAEIEALTERMVAGVSAAERHLVQHGWLGHRAFVGLAPTAEPTDALADRLVDLIVAHCRELGYVPASLATHELLGTERFGNLPVKLSERQVQGLSEQGFDVAALATPQPKGDE